MDRKKKWALKVCAGFFAAMVLATVLSRAAASVLVAEVQTGRAQKGRLSYSCEGDGTVVPAKRNQIFLWEGQQVEWAAKPGTQVKRGECLVRFRMAYLKETIEKKEDELLQLRLQASREQISARETARVPQTFGASQTLDDARRELDDARKKEADAEAALADFTENPVLNKAGESGTDRTEKDGTKNNSSEKNSVGKEGEKTYRTNEDGTGEAEQGETLQNVQDTQQTASWEQEKQELEAALSQAKEGTKAAEQSLKQAQNAYKLAVREDEAQAQNEANASESASLSAEAAQAQVVTAEKALKKLKKYEKAKGEITAKKNCTVLISGIQPGVITTGTEIFETGSGGFVLKGNVKTEDKEKLKTGAEISVQFQAGGKKTTMLETLRTESFGESSNPQNSDAASSGETSGSSSGLVWYAPLPDNTDAESGGTFTWSIKTSSEKEYEQIIPLSALREDVSEAYCLIVSEEKQMLGTVQTAKRVPVTVLEKDAESAAVTSALQETDKLITVSEKYVEEGDRVRIKE